MIVYSNRNSVPTKEENYRLYQSGCFGNKLRTWNTLEELDCSTYRGSVVIRYKEPGSSFCRYEIPFARLRQVVSELEDFGAHRSKMTFNESAPDTLLVIQGEVARSTDHLTLYYSDLPLPMRKALKLKAYTLSGLEAIFLLRRNLFPCSYDDLQELLDLYPDSVIEFSAFSRSLGNCRNRNTIFWEIRNY